MTAGNPAELSFSDLLELLGHDGFTSVCNKPPGGQFQSRVVLAADAPAFVDLPGDVWFGVNPVQGPARSNAGRGTAADVIRLTAVFADLDVKPGGMPTMVAAGRVVGDLAAMLGTRPVAIVFSGHGMQPYWALEADGNDEPTGADARALLRRFGRLVAHVAEIRGGHVDPVYDLARVLRVPGTTNYKAEPTAVTGVADTGRPLSVDELDDALTAYGAVELPGDRDEPGQRIVSDPGGWAWAETTCNYAQAMVSAWSSDEPAARHPWLVAQATRIAAAHRYGCFDADGHTAAVNRLAGVFHGLVSRGTAGGGARNEAPGEVADALAWGRDLAGSKTDAQIASELGGHSHEPPDELTFDPTGRPPDFFSQASAYQEGSTNPTDDPFAEQFRQQVEYATYKLRVSHAAREQFAAEQAALLDIPPFDAGSLGDILARPAEPPYRIEGLIPNEASTLIVAMRKTGKTTFNLNLARSLIFGEDFLGRFPVRRIAGNVGLLNYEVSARQIARWADEVGIPHDRLHIVNLRGRRNPLGNDDDKADLADWLRKRDCESLLVDPFGRAYTGQSQNDSGEVGAWLAELDRWARGEVGVVDLALAVHAGWEGERSRGASALEDWGDTIITMTRRKANEMEDDEDGSQRFLKAEGRDVDLDEDQLEYDPVTRLLSLTGQGGRRRASTLQRIEKRIPIIVDYVNSNPGCSQRDVERALGGKLTDVRKALEIADLRGQIRRTAIGNGFSHMPVSLGSGSDISQVRPATQSHLAEKGASDALTDQYVDTNQTVVPLFQAGEEVRPSASQVRPGRTPDGASPAYIYAGRAGRAGGTRNEPCSKPAHSPVIRRGRWECDDCEKEQQGGSAS